MTGTPASDSAAAGRSNVQVAMDWIGAMTGFDSDGLRRTMAPHLKYHLARSAAKMARDRNAPGAPADGPDPYVFPRDAYIAQHEHARRAIFVKPDPPELVRVADGGDVSLRLVREGVPCLCVSRCYLAWQDRCATVGVAVAEQDKD